MLSSQFHSQCKDCFSETYHQFAESKFRDGVLGEALLRSKNYMTSITSWTAPNIDNRLKPYL